MTVEYYSNNSGGGDWLTIADWARLEKAGWILGDAHSWRDGPSRASREGLTLAEAVREWEAVVMQSADEQGCDCCGPPHEFTEYREDGTYVRGYDHDTSDWYYDDWYDDEDDDY